MKIAFYTLGCKVNTYETESISNLFVKAGFDIVDYTDQADAYVINTCTVTNNADAKSRKIIRRLNRQNPDAVIAVMGCYSQVSTEEIEAIRGVDIILGTTHREKLVTYIKDSLRKRAQYINVEDVSKYKVFDEIHVTNFKEQTRAYVKIQDGCNNFCSYCIIPYARGPVRSRPKEVILKEIKELVNNNYKEIILTGIHTGGYGLDLEDYSLFDLLVECATIPHLKRLRLSSIEINELSDEIISLMAESDVFVNHLHIPLQAGSDIILKKMKRKYTIQTFKDRIDEIREKLPNIAITTDIITGFPTETDEDHIETLKNVKRIAFSELHVFPYSKRSGTKAAKLTPKVNGIIKTKRRNDLLALNETLAEHFIKSNKDQILHVLFESSDDKYTYGHTENYISVKVKKDESLHNTIRPVKLKQLAYNNTTASLYNP
ncbi:MAG: tRNA (N(6)-L-threonylcarbamoyladenosine(37)-C(2))-methylthiotransferase MtaB [Candidatus Izimaplasma sp.]|nr:tRNA (N(6)-L-threonylcarbamoyladenosine(37)-C(2))-methylthiotransferase MtaB [Candidatus Izimaplasma bacterium]